MSESAICPHLRGERTREMNMPKPDYEPPFPIYAGRFDESIKDVAMVLFGAVAREPSATLEHDALDIVTSLLGKGESLPTYKVLCASEDPEGRALRAWKAYWPSRAAYKAWASSSGFDSWWASPEREAETDTEGHGLFVEGLFPTLDRFETVYSKKDAYEGVGNLATSMSEPIQEHAYWGSARDRFPISQTDDLVGARLDGAVCPFSGKKTGPARDGTGPPSPTNAAPSAAPVVAAPLPPLDPKAKRVRVPGRHNLCVIHSGQDWSRVEGKERALYLETLHPTLKVGMRFLSEDKFNQKHASPREHFGCYDMRMMDHLDPDSLEGSGTTSRSFGLGYFDDLANLERWSKEHKTHLDIFKGFFKYAEESQGKGDLALYHEISVLSEEQQEFEYVNCPPGTGMLTLLQKVRRGGVDEEESE